MFKKWFGKKKTTPEPVVVFSRGLEAHGQREIFMAVEPPSDKDAPHIQAHIETLFAQIEHFAQQGRLVHAGDITEFGPSGFLTPHIRGILYTDPRGCVPQAPEGSLCAILIYEQELELYKRTSAHRLLTRLGGQVREFPCPHYNRWGRPPVVYEGEEESLLFKAPTFHVPGTTNLLQNDHVEIRLPIQHAEVIAGCLEQVEGVAFAMGLQPSPVSDAHLTWEPGQTDVAAISMREGADAFSGGHVVVVLSDEMAPNLSVHEDGFLIALSPQDGAELKRALSNQEAVHLDRDTNITVSFSWADHDAPHWREYTPDQGVTRSEAMVMLTEQSVFGRAVDLQAFADYFNQLCHALKATPNYTLTVTLAPNTSAHMELEPEHEAQLIAASNVAPPTVSEPLSFQIIKGAPQ